ncbi:HAD-IA family hydrolase [Streptomyces sp. NPDC057242]|uniref:HAD-IA family hydrolase n=1 Tax=Streptomyces sp. NPDC057242 TaxID=3346063 RepID=UPI003637C366
MALEPVELVVFDCDGALVDSERICCRVDREVFAGLGAEFTGAEIVERFAGSSHEALTAILEERTGRPLEPGRHEPFRQRCEDAPDAELTAVEGVTDVLDALSVPYCPASDGSHPTIRRNLGRTGLLERFADRIFSAHDVARGRPAPDLFLHAAAAMGVPPGRCAVVEDGPYGVGAARAAGTRAFGHCGGLTRADRLTGPGTVVFEDMRTPPGLLSGTGLQTPLRGTGPVGHRPRSAGRVRRCGPGRSGRP